MTEQQTQKRKPWAIIIAAVLLVIAGGVYGAGKYYERQHIQEMRDVLALVPAPYTLTVDDIDGSLFGRSLTLTGLKGSLPYKDAAITVTMDKVEGQGLNPLAFTTEGVSKLADKLTVSKLDIAGPGYTYAVASYEFSDLGGDFRQLAHEWGAALPVLLAMQRELAELAERAADPRGGWDDDYGDPVFGLLREHAGSLSGLIRAVESLQVGRIASREEKMSLTLDRHTVDLSVASAEATNYNLSNCGPITVLGVRAVLDGKELLTLDEVGMDAAALPSYAGMIELFLQRPDPARLEKLFTEGEVSFKNMRFKGMKLIVPHPDGRELPFAMREFAMSMDLKGKNVSFALGLDALEFGRQMLMDEAYSRSDRRLIAMLPEKLVLSGRADVDVAQRSDTLADVVFKPLSLAVDGLGSFSVSLDMREVSDDYYRRNTGSLASMGLTVVDAGASDVIFRMLGDDEGETPAAMRNQVAAMVEEMGNVGLPEALKELCANAASFLKTPGGAFTLNVAPASPVRIEEFERKVLLDPGSLGVSSSYAAGQ